MYILFFVIIKKRFSPACYFYYTCFLIATKLGFISSCPFLHISTCGLPFEDPFRLNTETRLNIVYASWTFLSSLIIKNAFKVLFLFMRIREVLFSLGNRGFGLFWGGMGQRVRTDWDWHAV